MGSKHEEFPVLQVKDEESQRPIPTAWRPILKDIVHAFVNHDYQLSVGVRGVEPVSVETADQIRGYIANYGEVLVDLPEETWSSSVCIWNGNRWDALVDLWRVAEGRSDLVLSVQASETQDDFIISVYMVYVP